MSKRSSYIKYFIVNPKHANFFEIYRYVFIKCVNKKGGYYVKTKNESEWRFVNEENDNLLLKYIKSKWWIEISKEEMALIL